MIAAGSLNERITLLQPTITRNSIGEEVASWTEIVADLPASIKWQKGSRALTFGDVWNPATIVITCRYNPKFEAVGRVEWQSKKFTVASAFGDRANGSMTITADLFNEGQNVIEEETEETTEETTEE